jgi:NUC153 domain
MPKKSKKELERERIRAALGLTDEVTTKKSSGPVGDLEITFTPGLSTREKGSIFENEPLKEETTAERYIRKEKERKARRKERAKATREGRDPDATVEEDHVESEKEDLGFDDPFFGDEKTREKTSKNVRQEERRKKREEKQKEAQAVAANKAELELLMDDNVAGEGGQNHFDINEIVRAEKRSRKKGKKNKEKANESKRGGLQEDFEINAQDPRFKAVLEDHEFAIDRSHPRFQETNAMKKFLEEARKRRNLEDGEEPSDVGQKKRKIR